MENKGSKCIYQCNIFPRVTSSWLHLAVVLASLTACIQQKMKEDEEKRTGVDFSSDKPVFVFVILEFVSSIGWLVVICRE